MEIIFSLSWFSLLLEPEGFELMLVLLVYIDLLLISGNLIKHGDSVVSPEKLIWGDFVLSP